MSRRTRRQWLAGVVGAGIAGIAGCGSLVNDSADRSGTDRATETARSGASIDRTTDDGRQTDTTKSSTESTTDAQPAASTTRKLVPDDGADGDSFGIDVAIAGDIALIGAHHDSTESGKNTGSAYLFARSTAGWRQATKLTPADGTQGSGFGFAVAIGDDLALVGAPGHDTENGSQAGSVYVFSRQGATWGQQARLVPDDGDSKDWFGSSIALREDVALVGAKGSDTASEENVGATYVFSRTDGVWHQQSKLTAADGDGGDRFGTSVSLGNEAALVGAPDDEDPNGRMAGSAYVFERAENTWNQAAKLSAVNDPGMGAFGHAVSMDSDRALVGAFLEDEPNGKGSGAAYVFAPEKSDWTQTEKIAPETESGVEAFGFAVTLAGGTAVIGAPDTAGVNDIETGAVFVFGRSKSGWEQQRRFLPESLRKGDLFGDSVALSGNTILVGSPTDQKVDRYSPGAAYLFE